MSDPSKTKRQTDDGVLASYLHRRVVAAKSGTPHRSRLPHPWHGTPYGPTLDRLTQEITADAEELPQMVDGRA